MGYAALMGPHRLSQGRVTLHLQTSAKEQAASSPVLFRMPASGSNVVGSVMASQLQEDKALSMTGELTSGGEH